MTVNFEERSAKCSLNVSVPMWIAFFECSTIQFHKKFQVFEQNFYPLVIKSGWWCESSKRMMRIFKKDDENAPRSWSALNKSGWLLLLLKNIFLSIRIYSAAFPSSRWSCLSIVVFTLITDSLPFFNTY